MSAFGAEFVFTFIHGCSSGILDIQNIHRTIVLPGFEKLFIFYSQDNAQAETISPKSERNKTSFINIDYMISSMMEEMHYVILPSWKNHADVEQ